MGAYMFFVKAKYQEFKSKTDGSKSTHCISKLIGKLWSEMSDEQKQPYVDMRDQDRVRHEE